jgi:hypothetical protein
MAIYKKLANALAPQVGLIKGIAEAQIKTEALKLLDKFTNSCPVQEELLKIIKTRNILVNNVNRIKKRTDKIGLAAKILEPPIAAAQIIIFLLKVEPKPVAIGTPPGAQGGLISAERAGKLADRAARLRRAEILVDNLQEDVKAIRGFSDVVENSLGSVIQILQSIDISATKCAEEVEDPEALKELLGAVQPPENTGSEGTPNESFTYRGANGKDYTLAIIEDRGVEGPIPRRVAVAKDNIGVIVLRGQPSFSSDTQVLLDELKFRIDNQLP